MSDLAGIHHVTSIATDAQRNLDFYAGTLGLRLVKQTVNFDDPTSPHFYYGDDAGTPGTLLTFFVVRNLVRGRPGVPQVAVTNLSAPLHSAAFWLERLGEAGVDVRGGQERFCEPFVRFLDPDGLPVEITFCEDFRPGRVATNLSADVALRGLHSVTLATREPTRTAEFLTRTMGMTRVEATGPRVRYALGDRRPGAFVDLLSDHQLPRAMNGAGVVHHVAFRVADDAGQQAWRTTLAGVPLSVSPVRDRTYFHSIYFHEPGGVLFEIATDGPGFAVDEPAETLGRKLMLPPQFEIDRAKIEAVMPPHVVP